MKNRIAFFIVGVVLVAWCILPDPMPVLFDDIIAGIGGAAALLKFIHSSLQTNQ